MGMFIPLKILLLSILGWVFIINIVIVKNQVLLPPSSTVPGYLDQSWFPALVKFCNNKILMFKQIQNGKCGKSPLLCK